MAAKKTSYAKQHTPVIVNLGSFGPSQKQEGLSFSNVAERIVGFIYFLIVIITLNFLASFWFKTDFLFWLWPLFNLSGSIINFLTATTGKLAGITPGDTGSTGGGGGGAAGGGGGSSGGGSSVGWYVWLIISLGSFALIIMGLRSAFRGVRDATNIIFELMKMPFTYAFRRAVEWYNSDKIEKLTHQMNEEIEREVEEIQEVADDTDKVVEQAIKAVDAGNITEAQAITNQQAIELRNVQMNQAARQLEEMFLTGNAKKMKKLDAQQRQQKTELLRKTVTGEAKDNIEKRRKLNSKELEERIRIAEQPIGPGNDQIESRFEKNPKPKLTANERHYNKRQKENASDFVRLEAMRVAAEARRVAEEAAEVRRVAEEEAAEVRRVAAAEEARVAEELRRAERKAQAAIRRDEVELYNAPPKYRKVRRQIEDQPGGVEEMR